MATVVIKYCDICNEKTDDLKEVEMHTPREYIKKELCKKCYDEYTKKILEIGEWLKTEKF